MGGKHSLCILNRNRNRNYPYIYTVALNAQINFVTVVCKLMEFKRSYTIVMFIRFEKLYLVL